MVDLADFRAIANRIFVLLNQASLQGRGSRRLDVDCSTGRRPMERADEPPPPILGTFRIWPWQGQKFGSTAPQATKFYHVELLITKWFRHWKKNLRYKRYISAVLEAAWRVTAELNEILRWVDGEKKRPRRGMRMRGEGKSCGSC